MEEKKLILVVDDDPTIVELLKVMLETKGYEVIVAYDGIKALELARSQYPDLIVLDLNLPLLHGYKVCRRLKYEKEYSHIPILMLTARDDRRDKHLGYASEADDYVTKPFDPNDVLERIKKLIT